jgi:hypothetical protein
LFKICRFLLGKTTDKEEGFAKKIRAWFNKLEDRDFDSVVVVPATRSPKLASMRQETIALLKVSATVRQIMLRNEITNKITNSN